MFQISFPITRIVSYSKSIQNVTKTGLNFKKMNNFGLHNMHSCTNWHTLLSSENYANSSLELTTNTLLKASQEIFNRTFWYKLEYIGTNWNILVHISNNQLNKLYFSNIFEYFGTYVPKYSNEYYGIL